MNPILSLVLVIIFILVVLQIIYIVQKKFYKSESTLYVDNLFSYNIDERYKIVTLKINNSVKTLLLGPSQAIVLDDYTEETYQKSEIEKDLLI